MLVPQLLLETLEELRQDDFEKLKWFLSMNILDACKPIPVSRLERASRTDTVSRMIESYGEDLAVSITVEILKKMSNYNAAEKLQKTYTEGAAAQEKVSRPLKTSSSAMGPPTAQKIPTDGATDATAPRASNATKDSMNISGNVCRNVGSTGSGNGRVFLSSNIPKNANCIVDRNGDVIISGNIKGDIAGDVSNIIGKNGKVIICGNVHGNVGPITGCKSGLFITGNVRGNVWGNPKVTVSGTVRGNVLDTDATDGSLIVSGNVRGSVGGNCTVMDGGNVRGNVGGNCTVMGGGNVRGNVGGNGTVKVGGNVRGNVGGAVGGDFGDSVGDFVGSLHSMIIRDVNHHVSLSTNKCEFLGFKNPIVNRTDADSDWILIDFESDSGV